MKSSIFAAIFGVALSGVCLMASCDDDLGPSIFVDEPEVLDRTANTFPLDTFLKANFLEPYNLRYMYRMEDIGADMQLNLVPTAYDKSVDFAVMSKYLWFDVYKEIVGEEFLKKYSPRIIFLVGSAGYNATSGTKKLGVAEGGVKITLMQGNQMNPDSLEFIIKQFFNTMHHEFGHIMHQQHLYPTAFKLISNGLYSPMDWNNTPDSIAAARGFASPYASSGVADDWVELYARYITTDSIAWQQKIESAAFDWELAENVAVDTIDAAMRAGINPDLYGYIYTVASRNTSGEATQYNIQRKKISRDDFGHPILTDGTVIEIGNGKGTAFASDGKGWTTRRLDTGEPVDVTGLIKYSGNDDGVDGRAVLLEKLDMVRTWAKDNFGMDLDAVRHMVQTRQYLTDDKGNFVLDPDNHFVNALSSPSKSDPSRTQIEVLRDWVNVYKPLQESK